MTLRQHVGAVMLPVVVAVAVPFLLVAATDNLCFVLSSDSPLASLALFSGIGLIILGLVLLFIANLLFIRIGRGTLAPWAPPQHLVVEGIYRHTRNPMIAGVLLILLGESMMFLSLTLLSWCLIFFIGNHVYFVKVEEPSLVKRFGEPYVEYARNVPRWIPRRKPWTLER